MSEKELCNDCLREWKLSGNQGFPRLSDHCHHPTEEKMGMKTMGKVSMIKHLFVIGFGFGGYISITVGCFLWSRILGFIVLGISMLLWGWAYKDVLKETEDKKKK